MTYPIPPASPAPRPGVEPAEPARTDGRFTPLWMLFFALALLLASAGLLVSRPVGRWVSAFQPTSTPTTAPTNTAIPPPTPTVTREPTRTPTAVPSAVLAEARPRALFETADDLRSIQMFDWLNGWGLGRYSIYRTSDGGRTWTDVTPAPVLPESPNAAAFFVDSRSAWFFDSNGAVDFSGRLYYTDDGGGTWTSRETLFGGEFPRLFFLDDQTGWVLTNSYNFARELYRTANGGEDWRIYHRVVWQQARRNGFLPDGGVLRGPVFIDPQAGWIGGTTWTVDGASFIFKTTDGGRVWSPERLALEDGIGSMWISPPAFFGPGRQQGVMVAYAAPVDEIAGAQGPVNLNQFGATPLGLDGARYIFFHSEDQGETWAQAGEVNIENPSPFSLVSQDEFFILDGYDLRYTRDGGTTWELIETNLEELAVDEAGENVLITAIQFVDRHAGWAWGLAGERLRLFRYQTLGGYGAWKELILDP